MCTCCGYLLEIEDAGVFENLNVEEKKSRFEF